MAGSAAADAARTVKASAKLSVHLAGKSGRYEFGQSKITKSRISGSFTCDTTYGRQPLKSKGTF